jgi:hypothetical protein
MVDMTCSPWSIGLASSNKCAKQAARMLRQKFRNVFGISAASCSFLKLSGAEGRWDNSTGQGPDFRAGPRQHGSTVA